LERRNYWQQPKKKLTPIQRLIKFQVSLSRFNFCGSYYNDPFSLLQNTIQKNSMVSQTFIVVTVFACITLQCVIVEAQQQPQNNGHAPRTVQNTARRSRESIFDVQEEAEVTFAVVFFLSSVLKQEVFPFRFYVCEMDPSHLTFYFHVIHVSVLQLDAFWNRALTAEVSSMEPIADDYLPPTKPIEEGKGKGKGGKGGDEIMGKGKGGKGGDEIMGKGKGGKGGDEIMGKGKGGKGGDEIMGKGKGGKGGDEIMGKGKGGKGGDEIMGKGKGGMMMGKGGKGGDEVMGKGKGGMMMGKGGMMMGKGDKSKGKGKGGMMGGKGGKGKGGKGDESMGKGKGDEYVSKGKGKGGKGDESMGKGKGGKGDESMGKGKGDDDEYVSKGKGKGGKGDESMGKGGKGGKGDESTGKGGKGDESVGKGDGKISSPNNDTRTDDAIPTLGGKESNPSKGVLTHITITASVYVAGKGSTTEATDDKY
jgi:hypothetical protein